MPHILHQGAFRFSGGAFLLVWDPKRRIPLHLRMSRIGRLKVMARTGVFPADLMTQATRYQIGGWTSAEAPFEVEARIRCAHWIQAFKEAPPALVNCVHPFTSSMRFAPFQNSTARTIPIRAKPMLISPTAREVFSRGRSTNSITRWVNQL